VEGFVRDPFVELSSSTPQSNGNILFVGKSAARAAMTTLRVGRGVVHIVQYLPPLLDEAHALHTQSKAEEEEAMGVSDVSVWWWV
jgi:hypothetical protein